MTTVKIPWKAWYGDTARALSFPRPFRVKTLRMRGAKNISDAAIAKVFKEPIGTKRIAELAAGKRLAAVAVDDISRPTTADRLLPFVLSELHGAGLASDQVRILLALGAHRPMTRAEQEKKLGRKVVATFDVYNHNPYENLEDLGQSSQGTVIHVNKFFLEADLRIAVGGVVPHPYAGYAGGGKMVLPGLCGIDTLEMNHRPIMTGITGGLGNVEDNEARLDIEECARKVGLDVVVNAVPTADRGIAGVFVGDLIKAHRAAVKLAKEVFATEVPGPADIVVLNAYPKDTEILQAGNAFNVFASAGGRIVKEGGTVVLTSACSVGRGLHYLNGPGGRLHKVSRPKVGFMGSRRLLVYSPTLSDPDFRVSFPEDVACFRSWPRLLRELKRLHPDGGLVHVYPTATLQMANLAP